MSLERIAHRANRCDYEGDLSGGDPSRSRAATGRVRAEVGEELSGDRAELASQLGADRADV